MLLVYDEQTEILEDHVFFEAADACRLQYRSRPSSVLPEPAFCWAAVLNRLSEAIVTGNFSKRSPKAFMVLLCKDGRRHEHPHLFCRSMTALKAARNAKPPFSRSHVAAYQPVHRALGRSDRQDVSIARTCPGFPRRRRSSRIPEVLVGSGKGISVANLAASHKVRAGPRHLFGRLPAFRLEVSQDLPPSLSTFGSCPSTPMYFWTSGAYRPARRAIAVLVGKQQEIALYALTLRCAVPCRCQCRWSTWTTKSPWCRSWKELRKMPETGLSHACGPSFRKFPLRITTARRSSRPDKPRLKRPVTDLYQGRLEGLLTERLTAHLRIYPIVCQKLGEPGGPILLRTARNAEVPSRSSAELTCKGVQQFLPVRVGF